MIKRHVRILLGILLISCSSGAPKGVVTPPPQSPQKLADQSPLEILSTAANAVRAKGSVHIVSSGKQRGVNARLTGDVGANVGTQTLEYGSQRSEIHFVKGIAYVRSNRAALAGLYGFPSAVASKYANKWLAWTSTDEGYEQISRSLTMSSLIDDISLQAPLVKVGLQTVGGVQAVVIRGKGSDGEKATAYIAAQGPPLPLLLLLGKGNDTGRVRFSQWGKTVKVTAPAGATRVSKIA